MKHAGEYSVTFVNINTYSNFDCIQRYGFPEIFRAVTEWNGLDE